MESVNTTPVLFQAKLWPLETFVQMRRNLRAVDRRGADRRQDVRRQLRLNSQFANGALDYSRQEQRSIDRRAQGRRRADRRQSVSINLLQWSLAFRSD